MTKKKIPTEPAMTDEERRERKRENTRRWREANPEKARESVREYARRHPEEMRERWRRWYAAHREEAREKVRRLTEAHLDEKRIASVSPNMAPTCAGVTFEKSPTTMR